MRRSIIGLSSVGSRPFLNSSTFRSISSGFSSASSSQPWQQTNTGLPLDHHLDRHTHRAERLVGDRADPLGLGQRPVGRGQLGQRRRGSRSLTFELARARAGAATDPCPSAPRPAGASWPGCSSASVTQPLQQRNTGWPSSTSLTGTPIEPSRLPSSTGQNFCASASARSAGESLRKAAVDLGVRVLRRARADRRAPSCRRRCRRCRSSPAAGFSRVSASIRNDPRVTTRRPARARDRTGKYAPPSGPLSSRTELDQHPVERVRQRLAVDDCLAAGVDHAASGTASTFPSSIRSRTADRRASSSSSASTREA